MVKNPLSFEALMGYLHGAISPMVEPPWKVTGQIWNCCFIAAIYYCCDGLLRYSPVRTSWA
jgi:hypothetical protein